MTEFALSYIADKLSDAGFNYFFEEYSANKISYPYFIGEYFASQPDSDECLCQSRFVLTATTNTSWLVLQRAKDRICNIFRNDCPSFVSNDGNAIAVIFESAFPVPTDTADIKRLQINFIIKEWSVK